jgi:MFS family permease
MIDKDKVYDWITDEGEERACDAIDEKQCTNVPGNFLKNSLSGFCSKLAEQLVSPGVTLPWLLNMIGASSGFAGLLVPIKNAGSLLPQLLVSAKIRAFRKRKYFWAYSAFFQAFMISIMLVSFLLFEGDKAGYIIVSALFLFSIASGVASVSFKDVMAKTIPKGRRGRLLATRATGGGVLTLIAGLVMYFFLRESESKFPLIILIGSAAILWLGAGFFFSIIKEENGATEGGRSPVNELKKGWGLFSSNINLRNFILTRAMLMAIPLAQPFFIIYGKEITGASFSGLGLLVIASGIAGFVSSPFWGKFADRSSRKMMIVVAILGILNIALVMGFDFLDASYQSIILFSPLVLINMMVHGGARLSRKTYLADYAPEDERPLYISLSNTFIGLFTIIAAGIGLIAELFSVQILFLFFIGMLSISIILSTTLKEV